METEDFDVCDVCGEKHDITNCPQLCNTDLQISNSTTRARMTLPEFLCLEEDPAGGTAVITRRALPAKMKLGLFEGRRSTQHVDRVDGFVLKLFVENTRQMVTLDTTSEAECNWLCLVPTACTAEEQNCMATQVGSEIYYITSRSVEQGDQLKVWYAPSYARKLGKPQQPDGRTRVLLGRSFSSLVAPPVTKVLEVASHRQTPSTVGSKHKVSGVFERTTEQVEVVLDAQTSSESESLSSRHETGSEFPNKTSTTSCGARVAGARRSCRLTSKRFDALELLGMKRGHTEVGSQVGQHGKKHACKELLDNTNDSITKRDGCMSSEPTCKPEADLTKPVSVSFIPESSDFEHASSQLCILSEIIEMSEPTSAETDDMMSSNSRNKSNAGKCLKIRTLSEHDSTAVQHEGENIETMHDLKATDFSPTLANASHETSRNFVPDCDIRQPASLTLEQLSKFSEGCKRPEGLPVYNEQMANANFSVAEGIGLSGAAHTCKFCSKTFEKQSYLARHIQGHLNVFQCNKCGKKFGRSETLTTHVCQKDAPENDKSYVCKFCRSKFRTLKYLVRHLATHDSEFKCDKCQRSFSRKESLLQHLARCHPDALGNTGTAGFPCGQCSRVFTKELSLHNHMKLHNNLFKCETCAKAFSSAFSLSRHSCAGDAIAEGLATETEDGSFECRKCGKILSQRAALRRHLLAHDETFSCAVCGKRYSRKDELAKHAVECAANAELRKSGVVECNVCLLMFSTAQEFTQHYKEHTHPYKCEACGRFFLRQANRDEHRCHAAENGSAECDVCLKKFSNAQQLQRHLTSHAKKKHVCHRCGRRFNRIDYLHDHVCLDDEGKRARVRRTRQSEEVIRGQGAVVCPMCGKNYASISNLNKHMKTHGEKKEVCDVCGKQFHLKVLLKEHIKYVHTDSFVVECPHCSKKMKSRNSLYGHIALFHAELSEKEARSYKCDQCGKVFRQKGNLKKHELTHSDKKTYACAQCEKTFKFPEQLRRHELWHRHGARHTCRLCDRQFVMEFELRKHVDTFHSGSVYTCKYCHVVCPHQQALKRHLQRCHFNVDEWQTGGSEFIKSMQAPRDTYISVKQKPSSTKRSEIQDVGGFANSSEIGMQSAAMNATDETVSSDFQSQPGTFLVTSIQGTVQECVVDGRLVQAPSAILLQTTATGLPQFDSSSVMICNQSEMLTGSQSTASNLESNEHLMSFAGLDCGDGTFQMPVSINQGSVTAVNGSEYFFISVLNNDTSTV